MFQVVEGIRITAQHNGAAPALITGQRSISYAELLDTLARVANHLAARLPARAKLFLNIADPDLRLIITIAAIHAGFTPFALLDIGDQKDEIDYDFVIGASALQLPELMPDLVIDSTVLAGKLSDGTLKPFTDRDGDDILFVGSTTGTTGRRKLVAQTAVTFDGRLKEREIEPGFGDRTGPEFFRVNAGDRVMSTLGDLTYAGVGTALWILLAGGTIVRASRDLQECLKSINTAQANMLMVTPGTAAEMMKLMEERSIRCPSVKRIVIGGALFDKALVERLERNFGAAIVVGYGSTETGGISAGLITGDGYEPSYVGDILPEAKLVTSGTRAAPAPLVLVLDPSKQLPYYVKGKALVSQERFFTLPDLGFAEGQRLFILGRSDEVYNVNGNKIAFSEIERAVRGAAGVEDAVVVGAGPIGDPTGLVLGVVGTDKVALTDIEALVATTVKAPKTLISNIRLFRIGGVPRNSMGKVDRDGVIKAYLQASPAQR